MDPLIQTLSDLSVPGAIVVGIFCTYKIIEILYKVFSGKREDSESLSKKWTEMLAMIEGQKKLINKLETNHIAHVTADIVKLREDQNGMRLYFEKEIGDIKITMARLEERQNNR